MKPLMSACVVTMCVMWLTACDGDGSGLRPIGIAVAPSTLSFASASIAPRFGVFGAPLIFNCSATTAAVLPLDLVFTAIDTANVTNVTIRLLDGTSVGGPSVTFPQPDLRSQFGTTIVVAGATRTFGFRPLFTCARRPLTVAADITFLIGGGRTQRLTVAGSLP
jgi:hypothetical protein